MDLFQVFFALTIFVGSMLAITLGWWAVRVRSEARRLQLARRVGNESEVGKVLKLRQIEGDAWGLPGHLGAQLRQAGDLRTPTQLLVRMVLLGGGGLLATLWLLDGPAGAVGAVLAAIPYVSVRVKASQRSDRLTEQLPDAMDLIARTLRAGQAFSQALRASAQELPSPIGDELAQVSEEHRLGRDLRACLEALLQRNPDNWEMRLFVSSVLLQRETGGNLVEMLDQLATTIRERIVFLGKVQALTAEVRLSARILGLLPFFVAGVILLMRPTYLTPLFETELGNTMVLAGVVSLVLGGVTMRRLAAVEAA